MKEKEEALVEEGKKAEAQQSTIDRLRQQAKGTKDGGLTALHRLQASQSRMEELNLRLTMKVQAMHHRKASLQLEDRGGEVHSRTVSAPTLPFDPSVLGAEMSLDCCLS